jgi:hypothetical protein
MHGIRLARDLLANRKLPLIDRMTNGTERFPHTKIEEAVRRAADSDSLKVIIEWN